MFSFLKKRWFLVTLGFVLLAIFIWFAGPYFAFADYHPLASVAARLIVIATIVVLWGAWQVLKAFKAKSSGVKLATAVVAQKEAAPASADARQLQERFEEALAALKETRNGSRSLYELPWYVIIGAPGSGKTTALVNSGLHFPLAQRFGKEALRGVGGTRNCDWWFTEEAVLLDTAGRYTTQDSDQSADSAGWKEFLTLLKKHRKRRPLNGVFVTISAQDLMTQSATERDGHVAAVRRRLDELNRELRIQLPIYLLVTKGDLIAGFTEYFDDLAQAGRTQVWGVTFPYEQTTSGQAADAFPSEFDALITRLNDRLFGRLEEERDARRRAAMFGFPQQVAALREALTSFVGEVFSATRFDGRMLLRGVYFTSGTQDGTQIDRLLGALGRTFSVAPAAVASTPAGKGKAYFIERLLKEVVFTECGLAGVNRRLELQKAALQLSAYVGLALIAVLGVIAFSISYGRNKTYLTEVNAAAEKLSTVPSPGFVAPLDQLLPRLDAVRDVVNVADRYRDNVPFSMRWGLYQGGGVGNSARDAYVRELDGPLLAKIAAAMRQRLIAYTAEPDRLYEYLKAYLMLGQPEHLDKAQLAFMVDLEWQTAYANAPDVRDALSRHFHSLLEYQETLRAMPVDDHLVAQARSAIQQASVPRLMYSRLKLKYAGDTARAVHLDVAAGLGADRVLKRKSGKSLSEPVPAIYTPAIFNEVNSLGTVELVKEFTADRWVLGDTNTSLQTARMAYDVMGVYEQDYIRAWDDIVADVQIAQFSDLNQATEALGILAAPTSPLRGLLVTVDANTFLLKPPDPNVGTVAKAQQAVKERLGKLLGAAQEGAGGSTQPGAQVTAHFEPIHKLVAGAPGQAPIDKTLARLGQIQQQMLSLGGGVGETNPLEALSRAGGGASLKALQQDAALLPAPINALVAQIGGRSEALAVGQARSELDNRYRVQVAKDCVAITSGRYPFDVRSMIDVPLADFGRLFGSGGIFDTFFKENLAPLVDASQSPWTWRAGASGVGASISMLRQFEAAQRIRDEYFRPGAQLPEVRFNITPTLLDAGASRVTLEIDGQSFEYRHGPERTSSALWPGPSPGVSAYSFEDRAGARPNQAFQGPWAWFRLLEGHLQGETDVRYTLAVQAGGHEAKYVVEAASIRNPFNKTDLRQFRCGG